MSQVEGQGAPAEQQPIPEMAPETPQPRLFTQDEVNKLAGNIRHEERERRQKDSQAGMSHEQIESIAEKKLRVLLEQERKQQEDKYHMDYANKMLSDFNTKLASGYEKYPDFQQKLESVWDPKHKDQMPELMMMLHNTENPTDVIADLADNPDKVDHLLNTWRNGNPERAHAAMQRLSTSIKRNETAGKQYPTAKEPLSQIRPSTIGADTGSNTVSDLRKQSQFRG